MGLPTTRFDVNQLSKKDQSKFLKRLEETDKGKHRVSEGELKKIKETVERTEFVLHRKTI